MIANESAKLDREMSVRDSRRESFPFILLYSILFHSIPFPLSLSSVIAIWKQGEGHKKRVYDDNLCPKTFFPIALTDDALACEKNEGKKSQSVSERERGPNCV